MNTSTQKNENKQLIIGLPETGKTTFLAALWHVVNYNEVPNSLRLEKLDGDRKHLNKIHRAWLRYQRVERTTQNAEEIVSMKLKNHDGSLLTDVVFPDMSGESFRQQWVEREWTKEFDELARESNGILLFVHSVKIIEPTRIDEYVQGAVEELSDDEDLTVQIEETVTETDLPEWDPKKSPTQVQLVELLQFVQMQPYLNKIERVAIIISAWDLLNNRYDSPETWLEKRLPLLNQYLKANQERFSTRIFGVSAQGGRLKSDEKEDEENEDEENDIEQLQQYKYQSERILIVGTNCSPHDITAPVQWLMEST